MSKLNGTWRCIARTNDEVLMREFNIADEFITMLLENNSQPVFTFNIRRTENNQENETQPSSLEFIQCWQNTDQTEPASFLAQSANFGEDLYKKEGNEELEYYAMLEGQTYSQIWAYHSEDEISNVFSGAKNDGQLMFTLETSYKVSSCGEFLNCTTVSNLGGQSEIILQRA